MGRQPASQAVDTWFYEARKHNCLLDAAKVDGCGAIRLWALERSGPPWISVKICRGPVKCRRRTTDYRMGLLKFSRTSHSDVWRRYQRLFCFENIRLFQQRVSRRKARPTHIRSVAISRVACFRWDHGEMVDLTVSISPFDPP